MQSMKEIDDANRRAEWNRGGFGGAGRCTGAIRHGQRDRGTSAPGTLAESENKFASSPNCVSGLNGFGGVLYLTDPPPIKPAGTLKGRGVQLVRCWEISIRL
jgi:hypothetical protein